MKRIWIIVVALVALIGVGVLAAGGSEPAPDLTTAAVIRADLERTVTATGTVQPSQLVSLGFAGSGRVAEVLVQPGDPVTEGMVLARLDAGAAGIEVSTRREALARAEARLSQVAATRGVTEAQLSTAVAGARRAEQAAAASVPRAFTTAAASDAARRIRVETANAAARRAAGQRLIEQQRLDEARVRLTQATSATAAARTALNSAVAGGDADAVALARAELERAETNSAAQAGAVDAQVRVLESAVEASASADANAASALVEVATERARDAETLAATVVSADAAAAATANAEAERVTRLESALPAEIRGAADGVAEAEAALQAELDRFSGQAVVSPIDGTVGVVGLKVGEQFGTPTPALGSAALATATSSAGAITVIGNGGLSIRVGIPEVDVVSVNPGQPARITFDALADTVWNGTVETIDPLPTVVNGVSLTFVRVRLDDVSADTTDRTRPASPGAPRAGMTANVTIVTERLPDQLVVPASSVSDQAGRQVVTVATRRPDGDGWSTTRKRVTLGERDGGRVAVLDGVSEGDRVVVRTAEQAS